MRDYQPPGSERRLWYEPSEIDRIMEDELEKAGLLPDPSQDDLTVDVERLVERHLRLEFDQHAELEEGVLGVTRFAPDKTPKIEINRDLTGTALDDEDATPGMVGRWRATVAHEVGHVLLHRILYEVDDMQRGLFPGWGRGKGGSPSLMRCLKRDVAYRGGGSDWREVQANKAIGALLMPKGVVVKAVAAEMDHLGIGGQAVEPGSPQLEKLVWEVARRFTVSKQAARIRIEGLGRVAPRGQASL